MSRAADCDNERLAARVSREIVDLELSGIDNDIGGTGVLGSAAFRTEKSL